MEAKLELTGTETEIRELLADADAHRVARANQELCGVVHTIRKISAIKVLRDELGIKLIDGKRIVELIIEKSKH
jgi:ribosomal protein L7/L12